MRTYAAHKNLHTLELSKYNVDIEAYITECTLLLNLNIGQLTITPTYLVMIYGLANEVERLREENGKESETSKQSERLPPLHRRFNACPPTRPSHIAP